jgi:hypothetical protein
VSAKEVFNTLRLFYEVRGSNLPRGPRSWRHRTTSRRDFSSVLSVVVTTVAQVRYKQLRVDAAGLPENFCIAPVRWSRFS